MGFSITATSTSDASATFGPNGAAVQTDSTSTISGSGKIPGQVNASATGDADASIESKGVKLNSDSASHVDYSSRGYQLPKECKPLKECKFLQKPMIWA